MNFSQRFTISALLFLAMCMAGWLPPVNAAAEVVSVRLWSRVDRSGPLRHGNIVAAAELINRQFKAAGSATRVKVEVFENNARGYDADALQLLKAFAAGKAPDLYVLAHEWVGEFAEAGYAMDLETHVSAFPAYYSDVAAVLWESVKYRGRIHAIPQDTEVRMFFYNKNMLRKIGRSEAFIEGLPAMVERGDFTIWDLSQLAKEVVDKGAAKYGILHRPNVGADYLMIFTAFGARYSDAATGKLIFSKGPMKEGFSWFAWNVKNGVTPRNNTSMSWDAIHALWTGEKTFIKHYGIWDVGRQVKGGFSENTASAYFKKAGFLHAPPSKRGGKPVNLSHPIAYAINPKSKKKELAAILIGLATTPYFNTLHAVGSFHIGINHGQASMPQYRQNWALSFATPMLKYTTFMPNHPKFGRYNAMLFRAIQGVETGRLSPEEAVEFLIDELRDQLGNDIVIE